MSTAPYFFWVYRDNIGEWRWRLWSANNHKCLADSGEGFSSLVNCERNIVLVKQVVPSAPLVYDQSAR